MIQASGGLMSITGPAEGEPGGPQKVGVAIADIMAGMYATTAVLAALDARAVTGAGSTSMCRFTTARSHGWPTRV